MDLEFTILVKVFLFWLIFYITPGPVWVSVMEATRKRTTYDISQFFLKTWLPTNLSIQTAQALISVIFVDLVLNVFSNIGLVFYLAGAIYILYLAYKVIKSKKDSVALELTFANLSMVMLLSPKIWLLFPAGAVIANNLSQYTWVNAITYAAIMLLVSNVLFFFYVFIGKVGTKVLKDNFAYLSFFLLVLFALFLFNEAFYFEKV